MVCPRGVMAVEQILQRLDIAYQQVSIGLLETQAELDEQQTKALDQELQDIGFEILIDRKTQLVEDIKLA